MKKRLQKILAVALAIACASPMAAFAKKEVTFSDISDEKYSWAAGYIEDMAEQGFISGYEDGTYRPDKSVTRLEVLSLFARAMGSNSEANADALKIAEEKYLSVLEEYELNFGQSDIAYLLYRGALKESELNTYLKDELKSEPMPRYEAAIIITKAMCAEKKATSEIMVDLEYSDAKEIPNKASQYVYYVTQKSIMSGMGDGTFSPKSEVLRSQIAVMLSKTVDLMNLTVEELKIATVDDANVSFYNEDEEIEQMGYTSNTKFYIEGELAQTKEVPSGVRAVFTYVNSELVYVDIPTTIPDETISGIFEGYAGNSGVVTVRIKVDGEIKSYILDENVDVTFMDQDATIRDFSKTDYVIANLSAGKIKTITGEPKTKNISNALIEEVSIVEDGTITISHALEEYNGLVLEVASDVKVKKNGDTASLSTIYKGDKVKLTVDYGIVIAIDAESNTKTVEGSIKAIEISASPKVTVNVKGSDVVYDVTSDVKILINNQDATIYDFRVGDNVTITLESQAIKRIVAATSSSTAYSKSGVVTSVNTAYGFIKISYNENDVTYEETVYCKDGTAKFITSAGTSKTLKDVKEGDVVSVRGTMTNGAFEATLIIIEVE